MWIIYSLHALGVGTNMATNSLKAIPAYNQRMRMYNSRAKLVETQIKARMNETFLARYPAIRKALTSSRSEVGTNAKMYELENFIRRLGKTELTKLEGNPALVSKLAQNHAKDPKLLANFKTVKGSYEEWVAKAEGEIAKGVDILWTKIDETDGLFQGKPATYYDVNVKYQAARERIGVTFMENDVLEFHLNIPEKLQKQGIGTEVFKRSIEDYVPSKVKGWWKTSDVYTGGESVNLIIVKEKIANNMTPLNAAFETPTGKILKNNGFGGTPEI